MHEALELTEILPEVGSEEYDSSDSHGDSAGEDGVGKDEQHEKDENEEVMEESEEGLNQETNSDKDDENDILHYYARRPVDEYDTAR